MPLPSEDVISPDLPSEHNPLRAMTKYYTNVQLTTCQRNNYYNPIGFSTYKNSSSLPATLQYSQGQTVQTTWNVTGNVSASTSVSVPVLAKVQATAGVTVGRSTTTQQSSTAIATMTIPANKTGTIYAFHGAVEAQGTITWVNMDDDGIIYGSGIEAIGGAFIMNGVYFENEIT